MYRISDDRRAQQSAQCLLEGLDRLTRRRPLSQITVGAVALEAGASRATFYRHFDALDDLLHWAIDRDFKALWIEVAAAYTQARREGSSLRAVLVRPWLDYWDHHPLCAELVVRIDRLGLLSDAFAEHLRRVLESAPTGWLGTPEDTEYFLALRTGEAIGLLVHWLRNGRNLPAAELADRVTRMTLRSFDVDLRLGP